MKLGLMSLGDHLPDPVSGTKVPQHERLNAIIDMAVRGEDMGYDVMAVGEHHFNDYVVSSPFIMLAAIAARTERIRLTTAVTLLPLLDPVRVAEDFNHVDQISGGRMELVLGRGISSDGYAEFGVDPSVSRQVLVEKLALLRSLWSEEQVIWQGEGRPPLEGICLEPRSLQSDPRVWMGTGMSEDSVRWTAEMGMPLMLPSIFKPAEMWKDLVALYRQLMAENGKADQALVGSCTHVHLARTTQQAKDQWRPYLVKYAEWANRLRKIDTQVDFERIVNGPAICGTPGEATERMLSIKEALNPDVHLNVFDIGGLPHELVLENMQLFADEVMPKIR